LSVLQENRRARTFWERLGYRTIAETREGQGRPVVQMEKTIGPDLGA